MNKSVAEVAVMDQFAVFRKASDLVGAQTPLAHVSLPKRTSNSSVNEIVASKSATQVSSCTVLLEEQPLTGMLVLRVSTAQEEFSKALEGVVELSLPERLQSNWNAQAYCVRWISPDEWMLTCPIEETFSIEQALRAAFHGHCAIVNVSGGYCILTLSGADAINVLKKSTSYDVNPENFPPGKVINTVMAKAQATLMNLGDERYEILVRRSFADYLWLWLQRAGREYGLRSFAATS